MKRKVLRQRRFEKIFIFLWIYTVIFVLTKISENIIVHSEKSRLFNLEK